MAELTMFAKRLKEIREKRGLKQVELAKILNASPQTVSAYEKAEIATKAGKNPTLESAIDIAKKLGVSLDWLCGIEDNERKNKTYGDAARDLILISKMCGNYFDTNRSYLREDSKEYCEYPSLVIGNETLEKFISKWKEVKELLDKKTIDEGFFQPWLDKQFASLDEKSIFNEISIVDDSDGMLPF